MYVCSLFALPSSTASTRDGRPHIFGQVEDVDTDFLVDTGASVTVISETLFVLRVRLILFFLPQMP